MKRMLGNREFYEILEEVVEFGIARYQMNYSRTYQDTDLVLYQKYTYEDACRLLNWERNEVPLNIGGYKYDKKTKTFPVFINYDKTGGYRDNNKIRRSFSHSGSSDCYFEKWAKQGFRGCAKFPESKGTGGLMYSFL